MSSENSALGTLYCTCIQLSIRRKHVSKVLRIAVVWIVFSVSAFAQKLDLALTAGAYHPVNNGYSTGNALAIEGNVGFRVTSVPFLSLYLEVPVAGTFEASVEGIATITSGGATSSNSYSAIFVTPGLRLKLAPSFPISPYIATGGGLAHFNRSAAQTPPGASNTVNKGVWDIGGGLDMKVAPFVGLRAEVRDFYSGSPELRISQVTGTFNQRQHNIVATAGIVLRF